MKPKFNCRTLALGTAIVLTFSAQAADVIKSAAGIDLTDGASWGGSVPTSADTAVWSATSLGSGLTLGGSASWNGIQITGAASDIAISGAGALTLGTAGINMEASTVSASISNNIALGGAQTWKAAPSRSLTASGAISGTGPLTIGNPTTSSSVFLTGTAQTLFTGTDLSTIGGAAGLMAGGFVNGTIPLASRGYDLTPSGTTRSYWMKVLDGGFTKAIKVELAQVGGDITVRSLTPKFISGSNLAFNFETGGTAGTLATSSSAAGYGAHTTTLITGAESSGSVILSGPNTFSGGLILNTGTLTLTRDAGFAGGNSQSAGTGSITVNPSASLFNGAGHSIWGGNATTRTVNLNDGIINISAGQEYFHSLNMTGGMVIRGSSSNLLRTGQQAGAGVITTNAHVASATITAALDMTFNTLALNVADGSVANDLTITGVISQNTGVVGQPIKGISKTGAGTALLSGANTFTGNVAINGGTLKLGNKNAFGAFSTAASKVIVAAGASVDFNGIIDATYGYTISGTGVGGNGALVNNGGGIGNGTAQCSNISLADNATIGGTGNWALLTNGFGATNLNLGGFTLTKKGANTFTLVNTTLTAGNITVESGTFATAATASNGSSAAMTLNDTTGVTLSLGTGLSIGSLTGGGPSGGNVSLGANTLTIGGLNTDHTYAGVISGTGNLVKTGSGILTLTGNQTYTGSTTLNGGTLILAGTSATTSVAVNTGATLNTSGTINGPVTIASGGTLTPAGNTISALTTGNATLAGTIVCQIDKSGSTLSNDLLTSTGTLTYAGTLEVTATGDTLALGDSFKLFDAATSYSGEFSATSLPALPTDLFWDLSSLTVDGTITVTDNAPAPDFNPAAGGYVGNTEVTISSGDGTVIHYTIDGSDPLTSGTKVVAASPATVTVPTDTTTFTINAYAVRASGGGTSATVSSTYSTITTPRWNVDENGDWSDVSKWLNNVSPNAAGANVDFFTTEQTGDATVVLDASRTVGSLAFGNNLDMNWTLGVSNSSILTFATGSGDPTVNVIAREATINAPIAGTQGLVKTGAGGLTLTAASTYSGGTNLRSGRLVGASNNAFSSGTITLGETSDPVSLYLSNRADISNAINVSASGTGAVLIGAPDSAGASNATSFLGTVTLNRPATFSGEVVVDRLAFDGRITGNVGTLTVTGGSRTTFQSITNDFVGDVVISGSGTILQASVGSAAEVIPDASSVTVGAGAILQLASSGNGSETINALNGAGTVRTFPTAGFGSNLTIGSANGSGTFSGGLINGTNPLSLTKIGSGTQTLSGINTYTGNTVVSAGTLALADNGRLRFRLTNTTTNTLTGAGTVTLDGDFAIDTSAVTAETGTWLIENVDTLAGPYGTTFQVVDPDGTPWTDAGNNKWTKSASGGNVYTFDETLGTLTLAAGGFESWADANAPGQSINQDHDGDGVPNGIEYFMGLAGSGFTANPAPDSNQKVSWPKGDDYAGVYGTDYVIQNSDDLSTWVDVPIGEVTDADPLEYTLSTGGSKEFTRLKVTGP